ncbi:MAG TPA: hypothetical protein VN673_14800, partial [Clostridia bacterium]|nr:hypothetical protein [Clostridia bacterium]
YERDRALFRKYIPLLRHVTSAGWQPVTRASCSNPKIWLERYGAPFGGAFYLTAFNDSDRIQEGLIRLDPGLWEGNRGGAVTNLVSGETLRRGDGEWEIQVAPGSVAVVHFGRTADR